MSRTHTPDKEKYEDENELIDEFCRKSKCTNCHGTDMNGEPNGYGCTDMEAFIEKYTHLVDDDFEEDDE